MRSTLRDFSRTRPFLSRKIFSSRNISHLELSHKSSGIQDRKKVLFGAAGSSVCLVYALWSWGKQGDDLSEPALRSGVHANWSPPRYMSNGAVVVDTFTCHGDKQSKIVATSNADYNFSPTLTYTCFTVADQKHEGDSIAPWLVQVLPDAVFSWLAEEYSAAAELEPSSTRRNPGELPNPVVAPTLIDNAVRKAFNDINDAFVTSREKAYRTVRDEGLNRISRSFLKAMATMGCSVMMGIFNSDDRSLRIVLTGEGRAVLGRRVTGPNGRYMYQVEQLTADPVVAKPENTTRVSASRPDESDLLSNERLLGWKKTRAFGIAMIKWARGILQRLTEVVDLDVPGDDYMTPPYMTEESVLTYAAGVQPGDFVILGSHRLWTYLENEEVVGLVGLWIEQHSNSAGESPGDNVCAGSELPVYFKDTAIERNKVFKYTPISPARQLFANIGLPEDDVCSLAMTVVIFT